MKIKIDKPKKATFLIWKLDNMKRVVKVFILMVVCLNANLLIAQSIGDKIYKDRLFTFPDGKTKAMIISYDDGLLQDTLLVSIMNKYRLKGTFNLNSGQLGTEASWLQGLVGKPGLYLDKNQIKTTYRNHEVAAHSLFHPHLTELKRNEIILEINNDIENLEKISDTIIKSFAYPFGEYNEKLISVLKKSGLTNARTVNDSKSFELPEDFYRWHPTCHHSRAKESLEKFVSIKSEKPLLFFMWGHSWEFDKNIQNNNWPCFEELCKIVSAKKDIWYVGAGEFVEYINAIKSITGKGKLINNSRRTVWIKENGKLSSIPPRNK
ncbi:MAG: polysaccharide deacetylase family protein [Labilibaculum sp.]|nr:polysaccharide deacetylase family protein [Labilibaculum sp.]MBI9057665.1 polysaccharide deacetylase family protein [Labilibaculum sp.]